MIKRNKRKGFTLVEMLVVIAIIAALVGIIVPIVGTSMTKANAATNAANLRAVKASLSTMMLNGEIDYTSAKDDAEVEAAIDEAIAEADAAGNTFLSALLKGTKWFIDRASVVVARSSNTYYGNTEGTMDVDGTTLAAPTSKSIKVNGLTLRANTAMTATVHENNIIVTYGGIPLEVFAIIAKEGDNADIDMTKYDHNYVDANSDDSCDICGVPSGSPPHDGELDQIGDMLDNMNNQDHRCSDATGDHMCDDETCGLMAPCSDSSSDNDHICDLSSICGSLETLEWCNDAAGDGAHKCTICGNSYGSCSNYVSDGASGHHCTDCNTTSSHSMGNGILVPTDECTLCDYKVEGSNEEACVTPDTLITLADGSKKRVDQLTGDEELLIWNLETGKLDSAPIMFVDSEPEAEVEVIYLHFSDGSVVKVVTEHGFWNYDLNRYIYLNRDAAMYIGHSFFKQSGNGGEKVQLVDVELKMETTTAWSPVTVGHLCYFVNDMLSMPGGVGGLFNIFEVNPETMAYDYEAMANDVETYGLLTYEELASVMPLSEDMFNAAGGAYLKISMAKGNLTEEELVAMITRYGTYFE